MQAKVIVFGVAAALVTLGSISAVDANSIPKACEARYSLVADRQSGAAWKIDAQSGQIWICLPRDGHLICTQ